MMISHTDYRTYLPAELSRRVRANPRYSLRAFAGQLSLSPGELSEIIRGRRQLSLKTAHKIADALHLSPLETDHLVSLIRHESGKSEQSKSLEKVHLSLELFALVSDWYCFALLNLIECDDFRSNEGWIAKRLGITPFEVSIALRRLEKLDLIERRRGKITLVKDYVLSPEGIPSEAVRNHHREILKKATAALELQSIDERDISGVGIAIDPKFVPEIKKRINDFYETLIQKYGKFGKRTEVYQMEVAFFRLTQPTGKGSR